MRCAGAMVEATGTGLSYDKSGAVKSVTMNQFNRIGPRPSYGAATIDGAAITGCGDLYADGRWNPKKYFAVSDGMWTGTVKVGATEQARWMDMAIHRKSQDSDPPAA